MTKTHFGTKEDDKEIIDVAFGNDDHHQEPVAKSLHLRWTDLLKSVETKDDPRNSLHRRFRTIGNKVGSIPMKVTPDAKKTTRVILDRISGEACPGEILATMGPSGSGKTSLMNVLSGRAVYQEGSITLNGKVLDKVGMKRLKSRVAYVKQQDILFETLSVRDQLTYTAQLRFPDSGITKEERSSKIHSEVNKVLELLKLTKVADNLIAMCSGGEKKRVNIGTELLTNPSIILLDEPTSGLDSASAIGLLGVLRDLAKNHRKTIITSIHQPNSATFLNTFDKLLMLSDGKTVYFGTPVESLRYLKSKGLQCPEGYNAADHWMDVLVTDAHMEDEYASSSTSVRDWSRKSFKSGQSPKIYLQKAWDNDAVAARLTEASELLLGTTSKESITGARNSLFGGVLVDTEQSKYVTSWWTQYKTLTHRALKKNQFKFFSAINIIKTISTGIVVGLVYFNQVYTESDIFNIYAYFFFTMLYWVMNGMFEGLFAFPQERIVILKERATASYRLSAYFCAMTTADMPVFLFLPFIFLVISYWMTVPTLGFTTFVLILLISLLSVITGQGMGQLVGAAFDDVKIGQAVATVVILFLMLLGGFFAKNVPLWLSWVRYVSPFAYASNAALGVIFQEQIPCDGSGGLDRLCFEQPFADPNAVRELFVVSGTVASNIACLLVAGLLPRLFAYAILRRKKAGERE
jgi:ABC-type multidrug transport system ATPase subunit